MSKPVTQPRLGWLAVALIGSVSASAFGQPASPPAQLPVNPVDQAHAWEMPRIDPAIVPPGAPPSVNTNNANPVQTADERAASEQASIAGNVAASRFVQAQLFTRMQAAQQQAAQEQQAAQQQQNAAAATLEGQPTTTLPPQEAEPPLASATPAENAQATKITLDAPTGLDARGANDGASLTWALPAAGHALRYVLYCDDGTLATASTQHTVVASDECPSQVALTAGTRPDASWPRCADLGGSDVRADLVGLSNGEPYAFALAALDETGNVGALSSVSCAIPSANGEYELDNPTANTAAAETGAGCSASPASLGVGALAPIGLGAFAVGAIGWARRRRRVRA